MMVPSASSRRDRFVQYFPLTLAIFFGCTYLGHRLS